MEKKTIYIDHDELAEMLDVPKEKFFAIDEDALMFDHPAQMWELTVSVGTAAEIEEAFPG